MRFFISTILPYYLAFKNLRKTRAVEWCNVEESNLKRLFKFSINRVKFLRQCVQTSLRSWYFLLKVLIPPGLFCVNGFKAFNPFLHEILRLFWPKLYVTKFYTIYLTKSRETHYTFLTIKKKIKSEILRIIIFTQHLKFISERRKKLLPTEKALSFSLVNKTAISK